MRLPADILIVRLELAKAQMPPTMRKCWIHDMFDAYQNVMADAGVDDGVDAEDVWIFFNIVLVLMNKFDNTPMALPPPAIHPVLPFTSSHMDDERSNTIQLPHACTFTAGRDRDCPECHSMRTGDVERDVPSSLTHLPPPPSSKDGSDRERNGDGVATTVSDSNSSGGR
ncbi:hypothetical protein PILCRDRAFT_484330 [Piloderma croceum F 1598]|uniref:Uncharacterized protein n=1 Tax=Piloderma croceum (strain F 1598) TaxID=765440 RepID=A0A0C3FSF5_PILCF|nr:hypothetical protein PILCRDRAFT_484330 [Piloderma croceum F 1598]